MSRNGEIGNPLETAETEKAWLAGVIEGDGAIGLGFQAQRATAPRRFAVKPDISFSNQDALLIEKVVNLFSALSGKNAYIREQLGSYDRSHPVISVRLTGMAAVKVVLEAILPYMCGEKQARARLLHRFISSRFERHQGRGNGASKTPYNEEEIVIIKTIYERGVRKGGKRNPDIGGILNDYTRDIAEKNAMKR